MSRMPPRTRGDNPSDSKASGNGPTGSTGGSGGGPAGGSGCRGPLVSSGSRSRGGRPSRPPLPPLLRPPRSGRPGRPPRSALSLRSGRGPRLASSRGGRGGLSSRGGRADRSSVRAAGSPSAGAGRRRSGRSVRSGLSGRSGRGPEGRSSPTGPRGRLGRARLSLDSRLAVSGVSCGSSGKRSFLDRAGRPVGSAAAVEAGASPNRRFRPELRRPRIDFFGGWESDGFFTGCSGPGPSWGQRAAPEHGSQQGRHPAGNHHDQLPGRHKRQVCRLLPPPATLCPPRPRSAWAPHARRSQREQLKISGKSRHRMAADRLKRDPRQPARHRLAA